MRSASAVSASSSSYDCLRRRELHELHFVELVLANQAAHVRAVGAGLAPEARRVGRELQGERAAVQDLAAEHVRQRHLGSGHQIEVPVAVDLEQVGLELRQVAGAEERRSVHQEGRLHLAVSVLARVHVEHEVDQRPREARPGAQQEGEACAGNS